MTTETADLIITACAVYGSDRPGSMIAVRNGTVAAVGAGRNGEDGEKFLSRWRGTATTVIEVPDACVVPGFVDTHNHLTLASRNVLGVPVNDARSVATIVERVRERAQTTPAGAWIVTAADWHEMQLAEHRFPTAAELDTATTDHPVLLLRGGHNAVLNSTALRLCHAESATGLLQDTALSAALAYLPAMPEDVLVRGVDKASGGYAAHGLTTVRDPAVTPAEWHALQRAESQGALHVRTHAMIMTPPSSIASAESMTAFLDDLESAGLHPGVGSDRLRLWGLKFVLDGGVEAAALSEPYADDPDNHGELLIVRDGLHAAYTVCQRRGWPVGTHAFGDVAIETVLDAATAVRDELGGLRPHSVVIEHAGLATPEQISRIVGLGLEVTAQQGLLDSLARPLSAAWGPERTAALFPWREMVDAGVALSAGTDHPIGFLDPLRSISGMTTRRTTAGTLGVEHAITRAEAIALYTTGAGALLPEPVPGTLLPGAPADLVVYPTDITRCLDAELAELSPTLTLLGGAVTHRGADAPEDL